MRNKITKLLSLLVLLSVFCFAAVSCGNEAIYSEGEGELNVLCTSFAPFDFAREIGGERVTVTLLQDSGADLHNYTPTAATLEALSQADVFIYIGGSSDEAWLPAALAAAGNSDLLTLCLIDHVEPIYAELQNDWTDHSHSESSHDEHHDHSHGHEDGHEGHDHGADEHIWTSVKNSKLMVLEISELLCSADKDGKTYYESRAEEYVSRLDLLDKELEEVTETIPEMIFADRFPFAYLLHDYHVSYRAAFSGCSTEINSGFEMQISLIEAVKKLDDPCIFTIEGGDKHLAEAIASETGCRVYSLDSMQSIKRSDIEHGVNYISIMEKNLATLKEAFKCH